MALDYTCPCCGYLTFDEFPGSYAICHVCRWEDDDLQLWRPDYDGGANEPSLIEAQAHFATIGASDPACLHHFEPLTPAVRALIPRDPSWRPVDLVVDRLKDGSEGSPEETLANYYYWRR